MLSEEIKNALREKFKDLKNDVKIVYYKGGKSEYLEDIEKVLKDVEETSEKIKVKVIEGEEGPKITFEGHENVEYWGIPAGYEFRAFVETIEMIGKGVNISVNLLKKVLKIKDIEILIFVTPNCPYCPLTVITANKIGILNRNVKVRTYEASEFPEIADKYNVFAVPKVVVIKDGKIVREWEGSIGEAAFIERLINLESQT